MKGGAGAGDEGRRSAEETRREDEGKLNLSFSAPPRVPHPAPFHAVPFHPHPHLHQLRGSGLSEPERPALSSSAPKRSARQSGERGTRLYSTRCDATRLTHTSTSAHTALATHRESRGSGRRVPRALSSHGPRDSTRLDATRFDSTRCDATRRTTIRR